MADVEMIIRVKEILARCDAIKEASKIILFGSRARNDYSSESDVDLMIVFPYPVKRNEQMAKSKAVRVALANENIDSDVLIKSQDEIEQYRHNFGHIVRVAMEEGIII